MLVACLMPTKYDTQLLQLHQVHLFQHDTTCESSNYWVMSFWWYSFLPFNPITLRPCICRNWALREPLIFVLNSFTSKQRITFMIHRDTLSKDIESMQCPPWRHLLSPQWFSSKNHFFSTIVYGARW